MDAAFQGVDADRGVRVVGGGDEDGVDLAGADELRAVGERLVLALEALELRRVDVADGRDLEVLDFSGFDAADVAAAHVADADDAETHFFHFESQSGWRVMRGG